MKFFLLLYIVLFTTISFASSKADYHILPGALQNGGVASIEVLDTSPEIFSVKVNYQLYKKIWVPFPSEAFKGNLTVTLPSEFKDERGYLELETLGHMDVEDAHLQFKRRIKWKDMDDAFQIVVLPKNGKSKIELTYHSSLPSAGWKEIIVSIINPLPIINGYQIFSELNEVKPNLSNQK